MGILPVLAEPRRVLEEGPRIRPPVYRWEGRFTQVERDVSLRRGWKAIGTGEQSRTLNEGNVYRSDSYVL